jgi:hypothetical protein
MSMQHPQRRRDLVVAEIFRALQGIRSRSSYPEPDLPLIALIEDRPKQFDLAVVMANEFLARVEEPPDVERIGEERFDRTRRSLSKQVGKRNGGP